jgi:O-antigen ligase
MTSHETPQIRKKQVLDKSISFFLWILLGGTLFVFDSHLRFSCRDAKELFQLFFISLCVGLLLWRSSTGKPFNIGNKSVDWLVGGLLLAAVITSLYTPVLSIAIPKLVNLVLYLLFFLALRDLFERHRNPGTFLYPLLIAAFISSIYAMFQYIGIDPLFEPKRSYDEQRWVVAGFMGQQTLFAGVIGPLVPIGLTLASMHRNKLIRTGLILTALVIVYATVLTHTRAVLLGYAGALVSAAVILTVSANWKQLRRVVILCVLFGAVFTITFTTIPSFQKRISQGITLKSSSIRARFHYWECSYELIREKPWMGWGFGSFRSIYPEAQIKIRNQNKELRHRGSEVVSHPHNELILIIIEGGIFLLIPVLLFPGTIMFQGWKRYQAHRKLPEAMLDLGCLLGSVILIINALFSFPFHIGSSALIGIVFAAYLSRRQEMIRTL